SLPLTLDKKRELIGFLCEKFDWAVLSRTNQVDDKYRRWTANYDGEPREKVRSTPWPNASNFMPQLIRLHTDIMAARTMGFIFGTKPFWKPTIFDTSAADAIPHEILEQFSEWMEHESFF